MTTALKGQDRYITSFQVPFQAHIEVSFLGSDSNLSLWVVSRVVGGVYVHRRVVVDGACVYCRVVGGACKHQGVDTSGGGQLVLVSTWDGHRGGTYGYLGVVFV